MKEINEKEMEQATGGIGIAKETEEELIKKGYTKHDPFVVWDCNHNVVDYIGMERTCQMCRYSVTPSDGNGFAVYCTMGL